MYITCSGAGDVHADLGVHELDQGHLLRRVCIYL